MKITITNRENRQNLDGKPVVEKKRLVNNTENIVKYLNEKKHTISSRYGKQNRIRQTEED